MMTREQLLDTITNIVHQDSEYGSPCKGLLDIRDLLRSQGYGLPPTPLTQDTNPPDDDLEATGW